MDTDEDFVRSWDEWRFLVDRRFDMAEGMEKGIRQGIRQGIEEGVRKTTLAMLRDNVPLPTIAKYTGLSEKEVLRLAKELWK